MPAPANLTYTQIETRVMNELRIPTTNATEQTKIQALINSVYRDIAARHDWWWLLKRQIINTVANITSGTLSMTNGSTSGTYSTAPTISTAGYRLFVTGDTNDPGAVYLINTHTSGLAAFTLDAGFTGSTSTGYAFQATQDSYALANDTQKVLVVRRYGEFLPVRLVGMMRMSQLKLADRTNGKPEFVSVYDESTTGDPTTTRQLVVHPYPDKTYRLEILYKQMLNTELSGTTRPLIPDDYVELLVYGALARGYPIFLNDTDRGHLFQNLFNDLLNMMVGTQRESASDNPKVVPEPGYRATMARRRRTTGTLGSLFDRWPSSP